MKIPESHTARNLQFPFVHKLPTELPPGARQVMVTIGGDREGVEGHMDHLRAAASRCVRLILTELRERSEIWVLM